MAHSHSEEDEHFDERQENIYAACSLLIQLGFDPNVFTIKNIYKHGYTDNEFLELIKPLSSLTDVDMDKNDLRYLSHATTQSYVKLEPYNFLNSVDFAKWLYEADGKRTLKFLSNKKKKNIVRNELTTSEVSLARKFIEYGDSRKLECDRLDGDSEEAEHFGERQKKIYAACSSLFHLGFDRKLFTIKNIYKHGYTDYGFLELIKPLSSIPGMNESDLAHLSYCAGECYAKLEPYKFRNFLNFAMWLYEEDGKRTVEFLSNKNKNIVRKELTTAEVFLARKFIEYGACRKQERDRIGEKIEGLIQQQKKLEMEYKSMEEDLERKLGPLYEYKEPEIYELRLEAYKLYEEDCKSKGITPIRMRDKGFKKAMKLFGNVAKERCDKLVNYLNDPFRQEKVRDFLKGKIYRMEHISDGGETSIVYKFATDVCEEISNGNIVYKHESEVREENSDGTKATVIYKSDAGEEISNVPPLPDSKKAKRQQQERKGAAKKMKLVTLGK
ncbi:hypothetical protein TSUD_339310 [Trifolium subterraneum]|nr:hypothetical protein TSUD_339310 [Trifolium subterraneum]